MDSLIILAWIMAICIVIVAVVFTCLYLYLAFKLVNRVDDDDKRLKARSANPYLEGTKSWHEFEIWKSK